MCNIVSTATRFRSVYRRKLVPIFWDYTIIIVAYTAAFSIRAVTANIDYGDAFAFFIPNASLIVSALYFFGVYKRIWSRTSGYGATVIVNAVTVASIIVFPIVYIV